MNFFLMMVIFSSKHGRIGKSGLVWIIGIHFIFIFLVILGFFRDVGWFILAFMVFWRCFWMKMGWEKKIR
jgi:lipopolysaccharide export LptBFGC system permease protein LptF